MSCFSCFSPRRKDVQNYDDDTGIRPAESSAYGKGKSNGNGNERERITGLSRGKDKEFTAKKDTGARSYTKEKRAK